MSKNGYIELVGKTIVLMEALRDEPEGLSLQELAIRSGQVKSSVHRVLNSLKRHGYVEQESAGGAYRLGIQVLTLVRGLNGSGSLIQIARPFLREMMETFDESAYLAILRATRGIFVDVQETQRDLRLVGPLGADVHFHATAAGKAMAAFLPADKRRELLKSIRFEHLTGGTLTRPAKVEDEWAKVRECGYAVNDEETIVGAIFLAAPVLDANKLVCASISVGVPKARYTDVLGQKIASQLINACARLSDVLQSTGYRSQH
ncbi:MAG: IclR family transcriptional regulator [Acidobacteriota bacterium]